MQEYNQFFLGHNASRYLQACHMDSDMEGAVGYLELKLERKAGAAGRGFQHIGGN